MIKDKLTHDERLRLECVAMSISVAHLTGVAATAETIIENAKKFEKHVSGPSFTTKNSED